MGVAAMPAPKGLGPQNPTKKLAHVGVLLGHLFAQNRVPKLLDPEPPPPLNEEYPHYAVTSAIAYPSPVPTHCLKLGVFFRVLETLF